MELYSYIQYTSHIFCDVVPMLLYIIIYLMVMYATASIYFKFMFLLHAYSVGTSYIQVDALAIPSRFEIYTRSECNIILFRMYTYLKMSGDTVFFPAFHSFHSLTVPVLCGRGFAF